MEPEPVAVGSDEIPAGSCASAVVFPLEPFLEQLVEVHGWEISVRDRLRVAQVLGAEAAWSTQRLLQVLGCLLARDPEQLRTLESRFHDIFGPPSREIAALPGPIDRQALQVELERLADWEPPSRPAAENASTPPPPPPPPPPLPAPQLRWVEVAWPADALETAPAEPPPPRRPPPITEAENPEGDRQFPLSDVGGPPGPMLEPELLDHLADALGYFRNDRPSPHLDVLATVRQTIANGWPTILFQPGREVCHLLILEDMYAEDRRWNRVAAELAEGMHQRAIPVTHGLYYGNPQWFRYARAPGGCDLEDWEDVRERLLVLLFTDGRGLLAAEPHRVLEDLAHWPRLAWMDLREEIFWDGATALALDYRIPVFPATDQGLLQMSRAFFAEQGSAPLRRSVPPSPDPRLPLPQRLEHLLGPALPWAETCACLPAVPLSLADGLRRKFHDRVPATAIGRFYALTSQYTQSGEVQWPEDVRAALFSRFIASRSGEQRTRVFQFLRDEIRSAVDSLPQRSVARSSGEALLLRMQLLAGEPLQVDVGDRLLQTPVGESLRLGLHEDAGVMSGVKQLSPEQSRGLEQLGVLPAGGTPEPSDMVLIPAGTFRMGDPSEEGWEDERPQHRVEVSTFYIGRHLVTWQLWQEVYQWAVQHGYRFEKQGAGRGPDHPVTDVSWYDSVKWCNARSEKERRRPVYYTDASRTEPYRQGQLDLPNEAVDWTADGYRLPTEAEWEKAARGGLEGHHYPWESPCDETRSVSEGKSHERFISPDKANYDQSKKGGTTPVGEYPANGYGFFDMAGNAWEWVWDRWDERWYGKADASKSDTHGPTSGVDRVYRGGGWAYSAGSLRCAYRGGGHPSLARVDLGFRLAGGQAQAAELDEGGERGSRDETPSEPPESSGAEQACLTVELLPRAAASLQSSHDTAPSAVAGLRPSHDSGPQVSRSPTGRPVEGSAASGDPDRARPGETVRLSWADSTRDIPVGQPAVLAAGTCRVAAERRFCWPLSTTHELQPGKAYQLRILMQRQPPEGMVEIPSGPFLMGDPTEEGDADERPRHEVFVGAFFIARHQVTWDRWREIHNWAIRHGYRFDNQGAGYGDDHPVHTISWYDAVKWCNACSEREGRRPAYFEDRLGGKVFRQAEVDLVAAAVDWNGEGYRLPTEAEWEKAARGGLVGHHYPWESQGAGHERFINSARARYGQTDGTVPVSSFDPNGYGLYNMAGNVWEWCWDWWDDKWYRKPQANGHNTWGPDSGVNRVYRGGSWGDSARSLRCACRYRRHPSLACVDLGFRLAGGQVQAAELDEGGERGSRDETPSEPLESSGAPPSLLENAKDLFRKRRR